MWRRTTGRLLAASVTLAALTVGVWGPSPTLAGPSEPTGQQSQELDEFFVVQAKGGTLDEQGDDLTLTLRGVERNVDVHSERPEEVSGSVEVPGLMRLWDEKRLDRDPPSAVLTVLDGEGAGTTSAFGLTDPSFEDGALTFDAEPLETLDGEPVAPELSQQVAEDTEAVPESFGDASLSVDPPNDVMQYCFARVFNKYGTGMVGKGVALIIPTSGGISFLDKNEVKTVSSMGTFACNIDYSFRAGSRAWGFAMVAATGKDNESTCGPTDKCKRTVTHDTSTYRVDFELLK